MDNYTNSKEQSFRAIEAYNDFLSTGLFKPEGVRKAELASIAFEEFLANRPAT